MRDCRSASAPQAVRTTRRRHARRLPAQAWPGGASTGYRTRHLDAQMFASSCQVAFGCFRPGRMKAMDDSISFMVSLLPTLEEFFARRSTRGWCLPREMRPAVGITAAPWSRARQARRPSGPRRLVNLPRPEQEPSPPRAGRSSAGRRPPVFRADSGGHLPSYPLGITRLRQR